MLERFEIVITQSKHSNEKMRSAMFVKKEQQVSVRKMTEFVFLLVLIGLSQQPYYRCYALQSDNSNAKSTTFDTASTTSSIGIGRNSRKVQSTGERGTALIAIRTRMEGDVRELSNHVAELYKNRCSFKYDRCNQKNYDSCKSKLPNALCPVSSSMDNKIYLGASSGNTCGGNCTSRKVDNTTSVIRLAANLLKLETGTFQPTDKSVAETICWTMDLDKWFQNKTDVWRTELPEEYPNGIEPFQMFYGSTNGMFRVYPGRGLEDNSCGDYNPRIRPWYVAAGSGPKSILIILDISGTDHMFTASISAIQRIISSTTIADYFSIVYFDRYGSHNISSEGDVMFKANRDNQNTVLNMLKNINNTETGKSDVTIADAFRVAFTILNNTEYRDARRCNTALLFFTDGFASDENVTEIAQSIQSYKNESGINEDNSTNSLFIFTYYLNNDGDDNENADLSISNPSSAIYTFACNIDNNVLTQLRTKSNYEKDIDSVLTTYNLLFAMGLRDAGLVDSNSSSSSGNEISVSWVEPYNYYEGNILGTTVSAPVYDRSTGLFIGVVGIDLPFKAIDILLGINEEKNNFTSYTVSFQTRVLDDQDRKCVVIPETICNNDDISNTSSAVCPSNQCINANIVPDVPSLCPSFNSSDVWNNRDYKGKNTTYIDRVCCNSNENTTILQQQCSLHNSSTSTVSPTTTPTTTPMTTPLSSKQESNTKNNDEEKKNIGAIVGGVLGGVAFLVGMIWAYVYCRREEDDSSFVPKRPTARVPEDDR